MRERVCVYIYTHIHAHARTHTHTLARTHTNPRATVGGGGLAWKGFERRKWPGKVRVKEYSFCGLPFKVLVDP